jgi:hypothetical protein
MAEKITLSNDISKINRILGPFYYWVFDDVHVIMTANVEYKDTVAGLGQLGKVKGIEDLKMQLVQVRTD